MKTQAHRISIPVILEVGPGKLDNLGQYIKKTGISKYVVFYGQGIREMFGEKVAQSLYSDNSLEFLEDHDFDDNFIEKLIPAAFAIPSQTEAIIGIGGGKVLDVAKYIAFLNNLPFISVPTSTAHDGFASSGCSLYVNGRRTTVHARMPYGIVVDTSIIKTSPEKFIFSGIGDIISKITAVFDWQFEESKGITTVDDFAVMMAKKSVNSIARMPFESIKEDFFIKELVDSLTMSGISMEIAGNSAPASGSEHLISHALDKLNEKPQLHGIQVGIATYIMGLIQQHRVERISKFLTQTGFFAHVGTLGLKAADFEKAIDLAPEIKPNRYTYIHLAENREKAKKLLYEDSILKEILK
ncbi:MAG: iron-containing alcohol dehydrogenase family protein [Bacillota bacterium]|nr:iron-containing alcohol dehydrogenase family protein [Bacillota bacterium]